MQTITAVFMGLIALFMVACGGNVEFSVSEPVPSASGCTCEGPNVIQAPPDENAPELTYCLPSVNGDPDPASEQWCTAHGGTCRVEDDRRVSLAPDGTATIGDTGCFQLRICR